MSSKEYVLTDKYEWLGEFWFSDSPEDTFPGILSYTPEGGIELVAIVKSKKTTETISKTVYGYTQETGRVTLMSVYTSGNFVSNMATRQEKFFCRAMICGGHFDKSDYFSEVSFRLNNLDEFCHPQGFKTHDEYTTKAILKGESVITNIELTKTATGVMTPEPISKLFFSMGDDEELKTDLDEAVSNVLIKHNNKQLLMISKRGYQLVLTSKDPGGLNFKQYYKLICSISNLFSILMLKTIKPIKLTLLNNQENGCYKNSFSMLISMHLTDLQIKSMKKDKFHYLLPVNLDGIKDNFKNIFCEWNNYADEDFGIIIPTLLNHIHDSHAPVQHYVLLLTCIEKWCVNECPSYSKDKKYDWVIDEYGKDGLKANFNKYLPNDETIGEHLSNIRTCIVHPAASATKLNGYKKDLDLTLICNLNSLMFILLTIALYKKMGVDQGAITKISKDYSGYIREYETIE